MPDCDCHQLGCPVCYPEQVEKHECNDPDCSIC